MRHSRLDRPHVFASEDHLIVVLDTNGPRDPEDPKKYLRQDHPLGGRSLRFSVTRGGRLKFAKKVHVRSMTERTDVLDAEGNPVPDPRYEEEMARYGQSRYKPHKREEVVTDTPHVEVSYEVDREWWERHGPTRVRF